MALSDRDVESDPLLPQNEASLKEHSSYKTTTKLGVVALILAATAGVSYYNQPSSSATTLATTDDATTTDADGSFTPTMPHIVFMFIDDMGMNDIGYKSSDLQALTPNINELAGGGIIFEKYYTMQLCTPARSALLTGKLPMKLGMQYENIHPDMPWGLPLSETIMPEYLKKSGYKSYIVGKWNQGHYMKDYEPTSRGFDSFTGYLSDEINYFTHAYPSPFGDETYYDFNEGTSEDGLSPLELQGTYTMQVYTDKIKSLIKSHDLETGEFKTAPMYLYYAAQSVHGPLDAPPLSILEESALTNLGELGYEDGEHRLVFASILSALDTSVKEIKDALVTAKIWDNTLLIFASDNGGCSEEGGSNAPLRGGKHWLFEGGVHVPAFVFSASTTIIPASKQGSVYDELFHVTDWMPTIMSAIDAPVSTRPAASNDIDGVDQWFNILAEESTPVRDDILIHLSTWTSCCTDTDGEETCSGFLSSCANSQDAVLTIMKNPRGAIITSAGYKLILNEYEIPWYGVPTAGGGSITNEAVAPAAPGPVRSLLSTDDTTNDDYTTIITSKDASGNPMNNCGSLPKTATQYWLFDLNTDPNETTDLYGTLPDIEADLMARIEKYKKSEVKANWVNEDTSAYSTWKANGGFISSWM